MDAKAYLGGSRADSSSPSKALSVLERAQLQLRGEKLSRATSARTISSTRLQVDDATGYPGSATSSAPSRGLRGAKPVYLDDDSDALGDSISITPSESSLDSSDEELEEYLSRLGNAAKEPSGGSKKPKSHAASATTSKTSLATTAASAYLKRPVSHQSKLDDASTPTRSTSVPPTSSPYLKTKETSQSHESVAQQRPTYLKAMKSFSTIKSSVEIGDDARFLEQPQAPKDTAERSANSSTPGAGHGQSESTSDTDDGSSIGSDFERFMGTGVAKDAAMSPKAASEPVEKETIETKYGLSSDSDLQSSPISISVSAAQVDPAIQTTPTAIASETGLKVPGPTSVSLQASSVTSHVGGRAADGVAGTGFTPDLHSQSTLRGATTASSTLATLNAHTGPSPAITTVAQPVPVNAVIPSNSNTRSAVLSPVQRDASPTPYKPTRSSEPKPHAAQIENESQVRPAEAPPNMDENSDSAALRKFGLLTLQDLDNPKSESVSGSSSLASNPESESIEGISLGKQAHSSIPRPESLAAPGLDQAT
ncbi:uncharacterized protein BJ171DRAFT_470546 [Polychytrium aggregatum]|uniref:uncharacterized protein n=1 Tax=Polychytrium aggregatum TaxID=110093 RepID=UPI0022FF2B12|nr:uncharacterized protein BJ171DRAFT_470546 [Polychytrium aggregatum]KAI9209579.1 hypothetical protein BJ171DRAFT_470546 [Polychytrium aggregatum]